MKMKIMIFLDANFLISLFINKEKIHDRAKEVFKEIKDREVILTTQTFAEVTNVLKINSIEIKLIVKIINGLVNNCTVIYENEELTKRTIELFTKYDSTLSFQDSLNSVTMEKL